MSCTVSNNYGVNSQVYSSDLYKVDSNAIDSSVFVGISDDAMDEDVVKKDGNIFNNFTTTFKGSINGKTVKLNSKKDGITVFNDTYTNGNINGKDINIVQKGKKDLLSTDATFQGDYNGKNFDLTIQKSGLFCNKTTIVGTIDGQEVKFELNGGSVPADEDVQDILSTILMLNGEEAKQQNGEFRGTKAADWKQQEDLEMFLMTRQAPTTNTYIPTWHYDNPVTGPTFY